MSIMFFARAQKQVGFTVQPGTLVVRPGWVAFLPSVAPSNVLGMLAVAAVGGFQVVRRTADFPLDQWWAEGEEIFDRRVAEMTNASGGLHLTPSDAEVVPMKRSAQIVWKPTETTRGSIVVIGRRIPSTLLHGWRRIDPPYDATQEALAFLLVTALPAVGALVCGVAYATDDDPSKIWGVVGWGAFVLAGWTTFLVRLIRARRRQRVALPAHGPYRMA